MSSPTPGTTQPTCHRVTYFDWLRGAATAAVVLLHVFNMVLSNHEVAELGAPLYVTWTWLQVVLVRWAVPCFLMISGALLLDPKRELGWRKLARYVLRMVAVLAIFCPVYACVSARGVNVTAVLEGLHKALYQESWDHTWYVYTLIGLYLLTPMLRGYVAATGRTGQRATLLMLGMTCLLVPTINRAASMHLPTLVWVSSSLFYYLLGTYAHRFLRLDGRIALAGILSLVALLGLSAWLVFGWQWYPIWLIKPTCPLMALWSLLVYLLAKRHLDGATPPAALAWLSHHSLGIYLVHPIALVVIYNRLFWLPYRPLPPIVFEVVVYALALGSTAAVVAALARVPGVRRIV